MPNFMLRTGSRHWFFYSHLRFFELQFVVHWFFYSKVALLETGGSIDIVTADIDWSLYSDSHRDASDDHIDECGDSDNDYDEGIVEQEIGSDDRWHWREIFKKISHNKLKNHQKH